jgi:phage protein D
MPENRTTPESRILINDAEIAPDLRADILEIMVRQYAVGGDCFEVTVNALGSDDRELKWLDSSDLGPGSKIEVQLGYRGELTSLIVGEITALAASFPAEAGPRLRVQGFDRLHRLRRGRKTRVYHEIKDSQIAEQIASDMGLTPAVDDSEVVHDYIVQNNLSDLDFLIERARRIRYEVAVQDDRLVFRKAANDLGSDSTLEYMIDLKSFSVRLSTLAQASELAVRGWNPSSKEAILGVARAADQTTLMDGASAGADLVSQAGFGESTRTIVDIPVASQAEAEQIARARFNDVAIELVRGEAEAVGRPTLRAGTTVELRGLGQRLSGIYYVSKAEHVITPSVGYVTRIDVERNAA